MRGTCAGSWATRDRAMASCSATAESAALATDASGVVPTAVTVEVAVAAC